MGAPRSFLYRVIKSSWGIRISIVAQAVFQEEGGVLDGVKVVPSVPVGLAFEGSVAELPPAYKEELRNGLGVVAAEISESVGGRPVTVSVLNLTYQECDFQVEGLAVAICRWAEQEFGLASHRVDESFDRERNRYVFDWH